jgi:hypothetical protein
MKAVSLFGIAAFTACLMVPGKGAAQSAIGSP